MLIAIGQHGKKASALNCCVELALKNCPRAGQACRNDLAVFSDEITQGVDVFVVDFLDTCDCEAAKALALEEQVWAGRLGRLSLLLNLLVRA